MKPLSERGEKDFGIFVAVIILWFLSVMIQGQEIENLGIVSARRGIILEHSDTNRTDFVHFHIEIGSSQNTNDSTIIIRTNEFLNLTDFGMISDGKIVIGVKSVYSDGDESPVALFQVEIRRTRLLKSKARGITIAGTNHASLYETLQARRHTLTNAVGAPMPSFETGSNRSTNIFIPMRGGTNKTYAEHMAEHFNRPNRK